MVPSPVVVERQQHADRNRRRLWIAAAVVGICLAAAAVSIFQRGRCTVGVVPVLVKVGFDRVVTAFREYHYDRHMPLIIVGGMPRSGKCIVI